MNYAVIKTGGKQYKVAEGDIITVERLSTPANEMITFSEVLMTHDGVQATFGQPFVTGLTVTGKVLDHVRGEKIRVAKFKAKARYRRVTGHRQDLSQVQIQAIGAGTKVASKKVEEATEMNNEVKVNPEKKTRKLVQK